MNRNTVWDSSERVVLKLDQDNLFFVPIHSCGLSQQVIILLLSYNTIVHLGQHDNFIYTIPKLKHFSNVISLFPKVVKADGRDTVYCLTSALGDLISVAERAVYPSDTVRNTLNRSLCAAPPGIHVRLIPQSVFKAELKHYKLVIRARSPLADPLRGSRRAPLRVSILSFLHRFSEMLVHQELVHPQGWCGKSWIRHCSVL